MQTSPTYLFFLFTFITGTISAFTLPNQTPILPTSPHSPSKEKLDPSCGEAITFSGDLKVEELPVAIWARGRVGVLPIDDDEVEDGGEERKGKDLIGEKPVKRRQLEGYWCCYGCTKDKLEGQCNYVCCQDAYDCCNVMTPGWWGTYNGVRSTRAVPPEAGVTAWNRQGANCVSGGYCLKCGNFDAITGFPGWRSMKRSGC